MSRSFDKRGREVKLCQTIGLFYEEPEKVGRVIHVRSQKNHTKNDVYGPHLHVEYVYVGMVAG